MKGIIFAIQLFGKFKENSSQSILPSFRNLSTKLHRLIALNMKS